MRFENGLVSTNTYAWAALAHAPRPSNSAFDAFGVHHLQQCLCLHC